MPTSFRIQSVTFSSYKHHNAAKGLVRVSPSGVITFLIDLYAGRFLDRKIKYSGVYDLFQLGDSIMADHGFILEDDLPECISNWGTGT